MSKFYIVPKGLIHSEKYKGLGGSAKLLYVLMYDKSLIREGDSDDVLIGDDGRRLFINYSVDEMSSDLFSDIGAVHSYVSQLSEVGLIRVVEQRGGVAPVIFVHGVYECPGSMPPNDISKVPLSPEPTDELAKTSDHQPEDLDNGSASVISESTLCESAPEVCPSTSAGLSDCQFSLETEYSGDTEHDHIDDDVEYEHSNPIAEPTVFDRYSEVEKELFGFWFDEIGTEPSVGVVKGLSTYLAHMSMEVIKYAIMSVDKSSVDCTYQVSALLKDYRARGVNSLSDLTAELNSVSVSDFVPAPVLHPDPVAEPERVPEVEPEPAPIPQPDIEPEPAPIPQLDIESPKTNVVGANRLVVLSGVCRNEFSIAYVHEIWVSMSKVIDSSHWDDLTYISNWLKEKYEIMDSKARGGETLCRLGMLMRLIEDSNS